MAVSGRRLVGLGAAVLVCGPIFAVVPALAEPRGPNLDPVREGTAPVGESDWWFEALHLAEAQKETTGEGVTIGLVEDSVDPTVPELRGQGLTLGDDCSPHGGRSEWRKHSRDPEVAHGTTMAALMVGNGRGTDHGKGIRGIAPGAEVKLWATTYWEEDDKTWYDCFEAQDDVWDAMLPDSDIVNMSFGSPHRATFMDLVERAQGAGAVVVAAMAANDSDSAQDQPWSLPGVVAVNAAGSDAKVWSATLEDRDVVITAPGVEVGTGTIRPDGWHSDVWHDGTSVATAIVSGALALVKAKYPDSTGNQLIQHLIHNAGGRTYGWNKRTGFGFVSVTRMLESSPTQWPDENPLLNGPRQAYFDYPLWSSSLIDAPADANDKWAKAERAAAEKAADAASSPEDGRSGDGESGLPVWAWLAGGAALIVVAVGATAGILRRRNSGV